MFLRGSSNRWLPHSRVAAPTAAGLSLALTLAAICSVSACGGDDPRPSGLATVSGVDAGASAPSVTTPDAGDDKPASATAIAVPARPALSNTANRCDTLSATQIQLYADQIAAFFAQSRARLNVLDTSVSPVGAPIDWIDAKSQTAAAKLASAPPAPDVPELTDPVLTALQTDLLNPLLGADSNLVPVARIDGVAQLLQAWQCLTLSDVLSKYGSANDRTPPPTESGGGESTPDQTWAHHYASTYQLGAAYGSAAVLQVPSPYVWRNDEFSLGQVALSSSATGTLQTLEAGWQISRTLYNDNFPHLFIYYTTNAYTNPGDHRGGYNREVDGWVQVSKKVYPGDALVIGHEMPIRIYMFEGNWWIGVNGEWMGYYPASLFASTGLGVVGDTVSWYGEITDYRFDNIATYTEMGNGQFAGSQSAYVRNIQFEAITGLTPYLPGGVSADKPGCYTIDSHPNSGTVWGSYFFYGGPGKLSLLCP